MINNTKVNSTNIKSSKGIFETFFIFLLSPFLAIPVLFLQLKKGNDRFVELLLSVFIGLLSFLYIPHFTNDKAVYISRYLDFKHYSSTDLMSYFASSLKADFIFDLMVLLFAKLNISFNYLFLLLTTFTVSSVFRFVKLVIIQTMKKSWSYSISSVIIVLLSFSFLGLFSGIRFILGGSIFIWSIYYLIIDKSLIKGVLFFAIAIFIHFSFAFFLPALLILLVFPQKFNPKILLYCSLVFLVLPRDYLANILSVLEMPESYSYRSEVYLNQESDGLNGGQWLLFFRSLWLYFAYFFLLFLNKERKNILSFILMILMSSVNLTYSIPVVFNRYTAILKIILVAYLVYLKERGAIQPLYYKIFIMFLFISLLTELYVSIPNIIASYGFDSMTTMVHVFYSDFSVNDILK